MLCLTAGLMPQSWGHSARDWVGAVLGEGTPVRISPRAGQRTEGPEMVLWDRHQCSEGKQQTGRSMPASIYRESVTTEIKKKVRIKCAAQSPDSRVFKYHLSGLVPLHSCMCQCPLCPSQGPSSQPHMARLAARHRTWGSTPDLPPASQRSLGNIKDPNISPVVMSKGYICKSFQFFLSFFLIYQSTFGLVFGKSIFGRGMDRTMLPYYSWHPLQLYVIHKN